LDLYNCLLVPLSVSIFHFSTYSLSSSLSSLSFKSSQRSHQFVFLLSAAMHSSTVKSEGSISIHSPTRVSSDTSQPFSALQIGLTGSIGMGKSTMDKQFRQLGFSVFDADEEVHNFYSIGGDAVVPIHSLIPDAIVNGAVNRKVLTEKILKEPEILQRIESIVHPLVNLKRMKFIEAANERGDFLIVHDIPLLFETQQSKKFDYVVVVTADKELQKRRVLARPGMTIEKFEAILKKQVPDEEKRQQADFLIHTDYEGHAAARAQIAKIIETVILTHPDRWNQWKQRQSDISWMDSKIHPLRKMFDMFLFDLDDTLVPVLVQLQAAQMALFEFMEIHMPNSFLILKSSMKQLLIEAKLKNPLLAHDLTALRRLAILNVAEVYAEESRVDEAMQVFLEARSAISDNLYDDVLQCFDWLTSAGVRIGILTNGNANLSACPALSKFLSLVVTAGDVGASKPSPVPFMACCQQAGIVPSRILYVGDSYEKDVLGAKNAGMAALLLLREGPSCVMTDEGVAGHAVEWDSSSSSLPPIDISQALKERFPAADVSTFSLLPEEIMNKLLLWQQEQQQFSKET